MATRKSLFQRVKPPKNAEEWLQEYEELLRRNKGGGTVVGYDTASNIPMYIPGMVADPTGLGSYAAQQPLPGSRQWQDEQGLLDSLLGMRDRSGVSQDELNDLEMAIDAFAGSPYTPRRRPAPIQADDSFRTDNILPTQPRPQPHPAPTPTRFPPQPQTSQFESGSVGETLARYAQIPLSDIMQIQDPQARQLAMEQRQRGLDFLEALNQRSAPAPTPDPMRQQGQLDAQNRLNQVAQQSGYSANNINLPTIKPIQAPRQNPIRQTVGEAVDWLGGKIGIPETGISEWIAGGPTRNTGQVSAADRFSEPDLKSFQPGEGVSRLQQTFPGLMSERSNTFNRPAVSSVNDNPRLIGDIGGIGDTAKAAAMRGQSDISDPFFKTGAADLYKDQLVGGDVQRAKEQYGGALNLGLFSDSFYSDPNRVASVFGNTYMGKEATDRFRAAEAAKYPLMDYGPGGNDPNYRAQVDAYNRAIQSYLGSIPSVLRSDASYSFAGPASQRPMYDQPGKSGGNSLSPTIGPATNFNTQFTAAKPVYTPPSPSSNVQPTSYTPPNQPLNIPLSTVGVASMTPATKVTPQSAWPQTQATPTSYTPPNQPVQIPLSTYGVGSVSPAPAPQPSQPSIFSWISNLFKKR